MNKPSAEAKQAAEKIESLLIQKGVTMDFSFRDAMRLAIDAATAKLRVS